MATDAIGSLRSAQAGAVIAQAWADAVPGTQVAVAPVGEAGAGFLSALADLGTADGPAEVAVTGSGSMLGLKVRVGGTLAVGLEATWTARSDSVDLTASSYPLGAAVATAVRAGADTGTRPDAVVVDLGGLVSHDGGAGLLAGLGATADVTLTDGVAGLDGLTRLDLEPVRALLAGTALIGVVPHEERDLVLLGLRGITSRQRSPGSDPAELLRTDASLAALARLTGPDGTGRAAVPGAGAAGGAAYAIVALGGALTTGTGFLADRVGLTTTLGRSDVLVTGCSVFDFATRGGGVVAQLARRAESALRPCLAIAGEVLIGGREMRTMGIESAYAVRESVADGPDPATVGSGELAETADRVARTWSW